MANVANEISGVPWLHHWISGALALLVLAGCASVSSQRITTDRMDYGQVVADPWKRQTLTDAPADAYAAVPYRGYRYWVDDGDIAGKRIFLFSLAETGQTTAAPVVTVPGRRR